MYLCVPYFKIFNRLTYLFVGSMVRRLFFYAASFRKYFFELMEIESDGTKFLPPIFSSFIKPRSAHAYPVGREIPKSLQKSENETRSGTDFIFSSFESLFKTVSSFSEISMKGFSIIFAAVTINRQRLWKMRREGGEERNTRRKARAISDDCIPPYIFSMYQGQSYNCTVTCP